MNIKVKWGIRTDSEGNPYRLNFDYPTTNNSPKCFRYVGAGRKGASTKTMVPSRYIRGWICLPRVAFLDKDTQWNIKMYKRRKGKSKSSYLTAPGKYSRPLDVTRGIMLWMDLVTRVEETFKVKVTKVCPNIEIQDGSSVYVVQADFMYKLLEACGGNKLQRRHASEYTSVQDGFPLMDAKEVNPVDETELRIPVLNKGTEVVAAEVYVNEWKRVISGVEKLLKVKVVAYSPNLVIRDGYCLHFLHSQLALKLLEINHV